MGTQGAWVGHMGHRSPYVYFLFVLPLCIKERRQLGVVVLGGWNGAGVEQLINEWLSMNTRS
jgi:hypothetical protein